MHDVTNKVGVVEGWREVGGAMRWKERGRGQADGGREDEQNVQIRVLCGSAPQH